MSRGRTSLNSKALRFVGILLLLTPSASERQSEHVATGNDRTIRLTHGGDAGLARNACLETPSHAAHVWRKGAARLLSSARTATVMSLGASASASTRFATSYSIAPKPISATLDTRPPLTAMLPSCSAARRARSPYAGSYRKQYREAAGGG